MNSLRNSKYFIPMLEAFRVSRVRGKLTRVAQAVLLLALMAAALFGCGYAGTPPVNEVVVIISPTSASVALGQSQQFVASVTGSSSSAVTWSVDSISGGNSSFGTISSTGLYTAPASLPNPATFTITAASAQAPASSASATVTLTDGLQVNVAPTAASVPAGGAQVFTATVSGAGSLPTTVIWSVNGVTGGNSAIGTLFANSNNSAVYTAPTIVPNPPAVTVSATSTADSSKSGSATVTIVCANSNSILPANATVPLGQSQPFTVSLCVAPGAAISWDVNGIVGGNATFGTIAITGPTTATFTAPQNLPSPSSFQIHAVSGAASAAASITLSSNIAVALSPLSAPLNFNQRQTFTPTVTNTTDTALTWTVNGISNGSAAVGQVCVQNSNPCQPPAILYSGNVDFLAPAALPATNPITLTATSAADSTRSASAAITIVGAAANITITISPFYAFMPPSTSSTSSRQFFASITGSSNSNVSWAVQAAVAGQGCSAAACGSISSTGVFTAPTAAPSPNAISITATSVADPTKSASATVAITSGPVIEVMLPSSTFAGAVESFPLAVQGLNFIPGTGATASTILINGVARGTTCATTTGCATALNLADVQSPGSLTIQIRNPAPLAALSNPVPFVILPLDTTIGAISLTSAEPSAAPFDLLVPEPTTAAASAPINVDSIGMLTAGNCEIAGSPVTITRPASGTITASLCIAGNGLDPTFLYAFSGPGGISSDDIPVTASAITGLFPNLIELDLQISSSTLPGVRTLLITTLNNDRAAATGMLEVK
jgi:Bacterial Ig-like domain (group 2)